ncbi:hypothetical protein WG66_003855 [Moniliophthora roreri]|nr:hypothetical protein WG66_003855 [Moniliophthora roreri]
MRIQIWVSGLDQRQKNGVQRDSPRCQDPDAHATPHQPTDPNQPYLSFASGYGCICPPPSGREEGNLTLSSRNLSILQREFQIRLEIVVERLLGAEFDILVRVAGSCEERTDCSNVGGMEMGQGQGQIAEVSEVDKPGCLVDYKGNRLVYRRQRKEKRQRKKTHSDPGYTTGGGDGTDKIGNALLFTASVSRFALGVRKRRRPSPHHALREKKRWKSWNLTSPKEHVQPDPSNDDFCVYEHGNTMRPKQPCRQ